MSGAPLIASAICILLERCCCNDAVPAQTINTPTPSDQDPRHPTACEKVGTSSRASEVGHAGLTLPTTLTA